MQKYFLVKESGCWADEFNLEGFKVVEAENSEAAIDKVIKQRTDQSYPIELYFGTNESQTYESREELVNDLGVQEITEEEFKVLNKLFPDCKTSAFGTTAIL